LGHDRLQRDGHDWSDARRKLHTGDSVCGEQLDDDDLRLSVSYQFC
jgi:hypothetical protein